MSVSSISGFGPSLARARGDEPAPAFALRSLGSLRLAVAPRPRRPLAAIHVAADGASLKIVRPLPGGGHETLFEEHAPLPRPEDASHDEWAAQLIETFGRYGRLCGRHGAKTRASFARAFRRRGGAADLIARIREAATIGIDCLTERDESRLVCRGVFAAPPTSERRVLIAMDGETVNVILATNGEPVALWDLGLQRSLLVELAAAPLGLGDELATARLREEIRRIISSAFWRVVPASSGCAVAVGGAARLVRGLCGGRKDLYASSLRRTNDVLATHWLREWVSPHRTAERDRLLLRALMLEGLVEYLDLDRVEATDAGPLEGMLRDAADASARAVTSLSAIS
jgi:exopolyphosphatase/pppGpp-phosphohydrolase